MDKTGHMFVGLITGIVLVVLTNLTLGWFSVQPENVLIYILIIIIYSLLSDLDMKNSTITWAFIAASIVGTISGYIIKNDMLMYISFGLLVITFLSATFFKHRGFTHTIAFGIIVSVPLIYFFSFQHAVLAFACFYSHLAADEEWFNVI